jgi:hypothetical protein
MSEPQENKDKQKDFKIFVNTRPREVIDDEIAFAEVVKLAFGQPANSTIYTVTYSDGPKENPQGTMSAGDTVEVKNGMIFNVTATTQS